MKLSTRANLMLLLVSVFWGLSYPILRVSVQEVSGNAFVAARFGLAAIFLLPWAARHLRDTHAFRLGAMLGCVDGIICALIARNIDKVPAARCAFIMGTSVVMVPIISALMGHYKMRLLDLVRAALSLLGLYALTSAKITSSGYHDLGILLAAALWAFNIVILKRQTNKHEMSTPAQGFYQSLFACVVPVAFLLFQDAPMGQFTLRSSGGLLYDAIFATVLTIVIQTKYQKHTSASQAGLRLSLEPLFASLFAILLFGEAVTPGIMTGGPLMILAIILPELMAWTRRIWDAQTKQKAPTRRIKTVPTRPRLEVKPLVTATSHGRR